MAEFDEKEQKFSIFPLTDADFDFLGVSNISSDYLSSNHGKTESIPVSDHTFRQIFHVVEKTRKDRCQKVQRENESSPSKVKGEKKKTIMEDEACDNKDSKDYDSFKKIGDKEDDDFGMYFDYKNVDSYDPNRMMNKVNEMYSSPKRKLIKLKK